MGGARPRGLKARMDLCRFTRCCGQWLVPPLRQAQGRLFVGSPRLCRGLRFLRMTEGSFGRVFGGGGISFCLAATEILVPPSLAFAIRGGPRLLCSGHVCGRGGGE